MMKKSKELLLIIGKIILLPFLAFCGLITMFLLVVYSELDDRHIRMRCSKKQEAYLRAKSRDKSS